MDDKIYVTVGVSGKPIVFRETLVTVPKDSTPTKEAKKLRKHISFTYPLYIYGIPSKKPSKLYWEVRKHYLDEFPILCSPTPRYINE